MSAIPSALQYSYGLILCPSLRSLSRIHSPVTPGLLLNAPSENSEVNSAHLSWTHTTPPTFHRSAKNTPIFCTRKAILLKYIYYFEILLYVVTSYPEFFERNKKMCNLFNKVMFLEIKKIIKHKKRIQKWKRTLQFLPLF